MRDVAQVARGGLPVAEAAGRTAGRAIAPAAFTARVVTSAADIDRDDWQAVCAAAAAPVFMDLRFAAAIEGALKPTCRFWFVIVYDGLSRPVAAATLTAMTVDFTDFGDPRVTWAIKYNPLLWRFRKMRMLFCSLPGSPGDRGIAILPEADSAQALAVLDELMVKIATDARLDAVVFKELAPSDLAAMDPLLARGYQRVEIPAMHLLDPAFGKSFAEYCAALRTRYRQQVNKSTRKLKDTGIVSTIITDPQEILRRYTPETHEMYREMTLKSDLRVEVLPYDYYRELVLRMEGQMELVALLQDEQVIAFGWCLHDADTYHMMYAGLDYRLNDRYDLYFNLMYAGFDRALQKGVKRIHVGQTATAFKARMGCFSEERYIYTKGIGFLMSRIFRHGSSLLVVKKPSRPPSDIFKRERR